MYAHPLMLEMLAKERQNRLLVAAREYHLLEDLARAKPRPLALKIRIFRKAGELLIWLGLKLQERYAPGSCEPACASSSSCRNGLGV